MNILAQIEEKIKNITNFSDLTDVALFAKDEIVNSLFLSTIEDIDEEFFQNGSWKENYTCNGFVERTIITPLGSITFKRRYYMNKNNKLHDHFYFADRMLEIPKRKHLSKEALAAILNMAVEVNGSYASKNAIPGVSISKQTVSNYVKAQNTLAEHVPTVNDTDGEKQLSFDVIYIEADEAHVNLQSNSKANSTAEIKTTPNDRIVSQPKNIIDKLVLTHTGHLNESLHLKRKELGNKHYFGGINMPTVNLCDNILGHLSTQYDLKKTKYIFISGDGAYWIKSLVRNLQDSLRSFDLQVIPVLDRFHCAKYLNSIFSSDQSALAYIRNVIDTITTERFKRITDAYFAFRPKDNISEEVFNQKVEYILSNLQEIRNQKHEYYKTPSSMEGHVSHVLADRLTSRPRGFCEKVLENLTQMILLKKNGYDITTKMIDTWSKIYKPFNKPKYINITKTYEKDNSCNAHLVGLDSSDSNLRSFLSKLKNGDSRLKLS